MHRIIVRWHCVAPIIVGTLLVSACVTPDSKPLSALDISATQPVVAPVKTQDATQAAAGAAIAESAVGRKPMLPGEPVTYVVQPSHTLALVARRREINGDSSMWMMSYRANAGRIPNTDCICPGQILAVPRTYTEADARAVQQLASQRTPWPTGAKAKGSYPCKVALSRAAASTVMAGKPGALGAEKQAAGGLSAVTGGGASVAEARCAPVS